MQLLGVGEVLDCHFTAVLVGARGCAVLERVEGLLALFTLVHVNLRCVGREGGREGEG